jgi:hypothetical protein
VAAEAAAAIIAAPAAMAADTGDQSYSAAPGVIDSVCVTPEMLRSTTPHRFSSVRNIPTGRAAGVIAATGNDRRVSSAAGHSTLPLNPSCAPRRPGSRGDAYCVNPEYWPGDGMIPSANPPCKAVLRNDAAPGNH